MILRRVNLSKPSAMTSFDKRFKKTEHIIVFPQQEFRVPLHQVHGQGFVLGRFDHPVWCPGRNDQILAKTLDGLVMTAVNHDRGTEQVK